MNTLTKQNNFLETEKIQSKLLFGQYIDADFTIVIPVYGLNPYFHELLDDIKNQVNTKLSIQIIVSDDFDYSGKNNNPVIELLKAYSFDNIAYFDTPGLHQFQNFNRSILLAKTKYVAMVHDDDLLVSNYFQILEKVLPFLLKHPKIGIVHGKYTFFSDTKPVVKKNNRVSLYKITKFEITTEGICPVGIPSCGMVFNRAIFLDCGGFNSTYFASGDAFIGAVMINDGYQLYQFNCQTGYYRVAANTSLKLSICQGFVQQDYRFYYDWCHYKRLARRIPYYFYHNFFYSKNIDGKVASFSSLNSLISIGSLDYRKKYKKYSRFCIQRIFLFFRKNITRVIKALTLRKPKW